MHKQNKIAKKKKRKRVVFACFAKPWEWRFIRCLFFRSCISFCLGSMLDFKKKGERNKKGTSNSHAALEELKRKQRSAVENKTPKKKRRYNSLFDNHVVILSLHTDPHTPHLTSCNPCSESALPHCLETELTTRAETAFCTACHLHTTLLRQ